MGLKCEEIRIWSNGWWGMTDVICTLVTLRPKKKKFNLLFFPLLFEFCPWQRVVNGRLSFQILCCTPLQWLTDLRHIYLKILSSGYDWLAVDWSTVYTQTEHMRDIEICTFYWLQFVTLVLFFSPLWYTHSQAAKENHLTKYTPAKMYKDTLGRLNIKVNLDAVITQRFPKWKSFYLSIIHKKKKKKKVSSVKSSIILVFVLKAVWVSPC